MKGGESHGIRSTQEIREEEKIITEIRREVKGALAQLHLAVPKLQLLLDKITEK